MRSYEDAAGASEGPVLAELFRSLAVRRRPPYEELEDSIRRSGNLPQAPDADREALGHLVQHLQSKPLADNSRRSVLEQRMAAERRSAELIESAMGRADWRSMVGLLLQRLRSEVAAVATHLAGCLQG